MPRVSILFVQNEEIDLERMAMNMCRDESFSVNVNLTSKNNAARRLEKNKNTFIINFLIDAACEFGFSFKSDYSRTSQKSQKIERIRVVYKDNKEIMNEEDIKKSGALLNDYFFKRVKDNLGCYTFNANDQYIIDCLKSYFN